MKVVFNSGSPVVHTNKPIWIQSVGPDEVIGISVHSVGASTPDLYQVTGGDMIKEDIFYTVLLKPNHKDLPATLLGITNDPEVFVANFLAKRTQFEMTKDPNKMIWSGKNTMGNNWCNRDTMEGESYARVQSEPPYRIFCNPVNPHAILSLSVEVGSDSYYAIL
jgi:hypothetical protein